jgi:hypothetical protein
MQESLATGSGRVENVTRNQTTAGHAEHRRARLPLAAAAYAITHKREAAGVRQTDRM